MSKLQKIEDVANPEVGRYYLVPGSLLVSPFVKKRKPVWLPIIGPWHEDSEIGISYFHWHYDGRFVSPYLWKREGIRYIAKVHTSACHPDSGGIFGSTPPPVEYRRRKMLRPMPEFPGHGSFKPKLEAMFKDHKLTCLKCPHRGFSLEGLPQDDQGRVVCNGHGLRWNLKTKRLAPR